MTSASTLDADAARSGGLNMPEYSVSEISQALKRTVEERFDRVRVRGEVSGFKRAASGHLYMALKDESAVLDAVCWKGTANGLRFLPEDGLEVIATGRLTTYPGRSKYQIVIEALEPAGAGALLALLEERKKKLASEGLFDEARKKPLPFLPEVIGIVTSPTGAVIRDILHRLRDRFPRHVLLWPVVVQGDQAAGQVAAAIRGFNAIRPGGNVPRPDLLIVARGGGSLEDLWSFNEEIVVRAAAESEIPLISAVGHETDTTLIDYASDRRAPTPTAAAEIAVPVRSDLLYRVTDDERRLIGWMNRVVQDGGNRLEGLVRGLPRPAGLLDDATQRLDDRGERLRLAMQAILRGHGTTLAGLRPRTPADLIRIKGDTLAHSHRQLAGYCDALVRDRVHALQRSTGDGRLAAAVTRRLREEGRHAEALGQRLESVSYRNVLARGFAVVRDDDGALVKTSAETKPGMRISVEFADGKTGAVVEGTPAQKPRRRPSAKDDEGQGSLL
ncbi:MAG: exodeoxyribonuclease VII large subunit [Rhodospirillaceae bacterium]|nr:exodeoxyribonuclease VII large subunit [Rhodospirillaceae bacterium]